MDQVIEMKNLVKEFDLIEIRLQSAPFYIKPFLCERVRDSGNIVLLCGPTLVSTSETVPDYSTVSELDLTGSPLACPFGSDEFDDTLSHVPVRCWPKEIENRDPLPLAKARKIINLCNLNLQHWIVPVWILCDASDLQHTVLLSTYRDKERGWATRSIVQSLDHCSYKESEVLAKKVRKEHITISRMPELKMKTRMAYTYDIQGSTSNYESATNSNISLHLSSSSPIITSLPVYADCVLEMIILIEQPTNAAYELWDQLKVIHQLVTALEASSGKKDNAPMKLPRFKCDDENNWNTGITEVLTLLQEIDYTSMNYPGIFQSVKESESKSPQVNFVVRQAVSGKSGLYVDFTHHLFLLLANCKNSQDLAEYLMLVFQKVQSGDAKLFVHPKNPTTVACILRELMRGTASIPELTEIRAVELLVEIGLQKLFCDFAHIFLSSDLTTFEQLKLPSGNINGSKDIYEKLDILGRLHATLEILLLAESQMEFSMSILQQLAGFALNRLQTQVTFSQLLENGKFKFEAPIATSDVQGKITRRYSRWCMQLTSKRDNYEVCTILYFSAVPVFPYIPAAHLSGSQLCDESAVQSEELYCSKLTCISNKLP